LTIRQMEERMRLLDNYMLVKKRYLHHQKELAALKEEQKGQEETYLMKKKRQEELGNVPLNLANCNRRLEQIEQERSQLNRYVLSLKRLEQMMEDVLTAAITYIDAVKRRDEARTRYQEKEQFFLDAQAGVLALRLREGQPCPVCGSTTHPAPAPASDSVPDEKDLKAEKEKLTILEEEAGRLSSDVQNKRKQMEEASALIQEEMEDFFAGSGKTTVLPSFGPGEEIEDKKVKTGAWRRLLTEYWNERKEFRDGLATECRKLRQEEKELADLNKLIPELMKKQELCQTKCLSKEKELAVIKGQMGEILQNLGGNAQAEKAEELRSEMKAKMQRKKELEAKIEKAFQKRQQWIKEKESLTATVQTLSDQLPENNGPAMEDIQVRKNLLEQREKELSSVTRRLYADNKTNQGILDHVVKRKVEVERAEHRYIWLKNLADTAGGTLAGKQKVELETYIQMTFLDRILRRANLRLLTMSGGQYELKRQEDGGNRREKAGLELDVVDHYNGTIRSVKTLSGGEGFKASLSLALGLSDEIQASAGGIQLDAMFIDEGFGSLDDESLSQAMKALTSLADGNRMVGIISHVAELKEKIENKIIVTKSRNVEQIGSKVSVITV